jgi:tetratricopeptide (TPR) repeat protein
MSMFRRMVLAVAVLSLPFSLPAPSIATQQDESSTQNETKQDTAARDAKAAEESSSKETQVDLTPPKDDAKNHPMSGSAVSDAEDAASDDVQEFRAWDPHKAAKDVEVGDFYFKRKNYRAALERYKDALVYKPNDAIANFRLAQCQEKVGNSDEAVAHYQEYLKILPHGPFAEEAQKSLERLKRPSAKDNPAK